MDRLIYTDRKTSNLKSLIIEYARIAITGIIMGIGAFLVLRSQFGLSAGGGIMSGSFSGGLVRSWNQIADTLAGKDGIFLDQLEGASGASGQFLTTVLLFFIVLSVLIARSRNKWFVIIFPLLFLPITIGFGLTASLISMAILALGVVMFLAATPDRKDEIGRWRWSRMAYALAACGLAMVIICVPAVSKLVDKPDSLQKIDDKASNKVVTSFYGESPLGDGDLSKPKRKTGTGTALTVNMSQPQSVYLRGFVGDVLDGTKWETLPYSSYYENRNLIYWINGSGFNGLGQIGQAAQLANVNPIREAHVDIEVEEASKKYAYIPYEISEDGIEETKNWNDSFVTSTRGSRLKEYSYTMGGTAFDKWTNVAGALFTSADNPEIQRYLEVESYYNTYVYENYLYISEEDGEALARYVGDKGDQSRGHIEYNTAISMVKNTLLAYLTYDEAPGKVRGKRSAVRNIFRLGLGYDVHYATIATLLFRYYGIPARYVEGYIITQQDLYEHPDGSFEVKQASAHAWTEIYVDGVGFVPVETCPEYMGMMAEADYTVGISNKSVDNSFDENKAKGKAPKDRYKDSNKGVNKVVSRVLMILGIVIGLAILALIGILVWRIVKKKLLLRKRKKFFREGDTRESVRDMYRYMDEIGFTADEMTREIGNRACYSTHEVTEHDRQVMLAVLSGAKKQLREKKIKEKERRKQEQKQNRYLAKSEEKRMSRKDRRAAKKEGKTKDKAENIAENTTDSTIENKTEGITEEKAENKLKKGKAKLAAKFRGKKES